ncbi:MAG TPA: hypothetical protein P5121_35795, partial [Caldilineaceae bacterium]|nr:hypothetical protein [Caldilineaceae bacterium]
MKQRTLYPMIKWALFESGHSGKSGTYRFQTKRMIGALGALLLAIWLLPGVARAVCGGGNFSDFCSSQFGLTGTLSAVGSPTSSSFPAVDQSQLPSAGALFYADYKALEAEARSLLQRNLTFRQDISPYRGSANFDELVRKFDTNSGFSALYDDPDPTINQMTLQQRIDLADAELRRARDLYAFLAVYAPETRLRADNGTDSVPGANYKDDLCANAEEPNPADPQNSGQVLNPVIDWCNFGARLRQSVREAANLRMLFAQQFMVDALSLQFSSKLLGGETMVRQEVAKFEAARNQYDLAETGLTEALAIRVGSGCLVSDFFDQSEWALLSRIAENRVLAQHHIALRYSYLDITNPENVAQAQAKAEDAYRAAATEGYINLVGMAGVASKAPAESCAKGSRPDGTLVAGLALNMVETQRRVSEMSDGRNVYGFDVNFTPARPYFQEGQSQGLWNEAMSLAQEAQRVAEEVELSNRIFDQNQAQLLASVKEIQTTLDIEVSNDLSCGRVAGDTNDEAFFACAYGQIDELNRCAELVRTPPEQNLFEQCMARTENGVPVINGGSTAQQTLQDLRAAYLEQYSILKRAENITKRIQLSNDRNATVTKWLLTAGTAQTVADVAGATMDMIGVVSGADNYVWQYIGFGVGGANIAAQATAGALSTAADVEIANAENQEQIENMLLDQSE